LLGKKKREQRERREEREERGERRRAERAPIQGDPTLGGHPGFRSF
jgi:hypothetical protein